MFFFENAIYLSIVGFIFKVHFGYYFVHFKHAFWQKLRVIQKLIKVRCFLYLVDFLILVELLVLLSLFLRTVGLIIHLFKL